MDQERKYFPRTDRKLPPWLCVNTTAKQEREKAIKSNKQAHLSPLSLLVWGDKSAADVGMLGADTGAAVTKTELKSSGPAAQFLDLVLGWNWADAWALEPILDKLCLDLKLTWSVLSAVRSHEENSFSSREGPRGLNEEQVS